MSTLPPWIFALGWERFMALHSSHPEEFLRLLRQPQHFVTPDGRRFAPLRLVRELGSGATFPVDRKDSVVAQSLHAELSAQGWLILRDGDTGFDAAFAGWSAWCLSFGADNYPRNFQGDDPRAGRSFAVPAS